MKSCRFRLQPFPDSRPVPPLFFLPVLLLAAAAAPGLSPAAEAPAGAARVSGLRFDGIVGGSGGGPGQFSRPIALAATASGVLLVADEGNNRVQGFDPSGAFLWEVGGIGTAEGSLRRPIAVAQSGGLGFLILDAGSRHVLEFHARGDYLGVGLDFEADDLAGRLGRVDPRGIATDRSGNVFATDREGDRLLVFSPRWDLLYVAGGFGGGAQSFEEPEGVASAGDRIFVADSGNGRIQVLDAQGRFLGSWPLPAGGRPVGVAVDAHLNVFVADADGDRVVVFGPGGGVSATFGARGRGPGGFRGPAALCVTGDRLLVADAGNDRLVRLEIEYLASPPPPKARDREE